MRLPLSVACWDYDRTRALIDGRVAIEGCDAAFFPLPVEETFFRALRHAEFDVAELSLSSYLVLVDRGRSPYVAIPAFPSRLFRHSSVYIRSDRGIEPTRERPAEDKVLCVLGDVDEAAGAVITFAEPGHVDVAIMIDLGK